VSSLSEHRTSLARALDQLRSIDGFPIGKDEDIVALSDPPYYTACPNPFIGDFIKQHGKPYDPSTDHYHREPFAFDVSEGKNDPIYNAHSYHTKVPHKAIMRYILHYTEPGDLVFDGFCGTGMTGVAAWSCGAPDAEFKAQIEREMPGAKWGARKAILCDLSPAATFIAYNYNTPVDVAEFESDAKRILAEVERECGWMYETNHTIGGKQQFRTEIGGSKVPLKGRINYTVWSDVFVCPECSRELVYWEITVIEIGYKDALVNENIHCPFCNAHLFKKDLERVDETVFDYGTNQTIKRAKQVPVLINYSIIEEKNQKYGKRYEKKPDADDLALIRRIDATKIPYWYPIDRMPDGDEARRNDNTGITHVHHFYTKRNLWILSAIREKISLVEKKRHSNFLKNWFSSSLSRSFKLNRYMAEHNRHVGPLSGTLYISSTQAEISPFYFFSEKIKSNFELKIIPNYILITTQSSSSFPQITNSNSIDYIFTDPPFGGNLMYSELNFLWEAWLKIFTNNKQEAIVNATQKKGLAEYQRLMEQCFKENYRILKPGRWMTVEFHNSQNSVWMAIQEALMRAGFIVADVRTLDKQKGTTKQLTYVSGAVKQDLVISAYKPNGGLEKAFTLKAGTEEAVWDFVNQHLLHLPLFTDKTGQMTIIFERQYYLLFDRMVAFHVQRGISVPISAADFYRGLTERYPERDGMFFLPSQVSEYDRRKLSVKSVEQLTLFVHDEKSAVSWLRQELKKPQTYQDLQPQFMQKSMNLDKHEQLPELSVILEENFLKDSAGKWYIPDPNRQADLEKMRERDLLKEFDQMLATKGKLKQFRAEAVRAGFKRAWSAKDYKSIIETGERLPESVLQEDEVLLMYYDNAVMREGGK